MRQDALATRARLVRAAEDLFATRGLDAVSMNEVQRAAGQRNKSALQYHFGSKEELLRAILDKHVPGLELERHGLLDELEARGGVTPRDLMEALAVPIFKKLDDEDGGPAYVTIFAQLIGSPAHSTLWSTAMRANRGADRLMRLLARVCPELPPALRMPRYLLVMELLFHGTADYGRLVAAEPAMFAGASRELVLSNLVDVLTSVVTAPVSAATSNLLVQAPQKTAARKKSLGANHE